MFPQAYEEGHSRDPLRVRSGDPQFSSHSPKVSNSNGGGAYAESGPGRLVQKPPAPHGTLSSTLWRLKFLVREYLFGIPCHAIRPTSDKPTQNGYSLSLFWNFILLQRSHDIVHALSICAENFLPLARFHLPSNRDACSLGGTENGK